MEPENGPLEDYVLLQLLFSGSMLIFQGALSDFKYL